ncbi:hypothetical protein NA56DRAFT_663829 [Hyaloscypha hepaticicola]|uniref:Uncharacterized protein n=1 Tax=Hyaloscypha hepaticicola TaxID=2082293 RepID=A0A2J6PMX9_9HELO|nr:hypothetical protein NA56DRAFT_663829 [Hyaloscypha hepaticicola]
MAFLPQTPPSTGMSFNSFSESPDYRSFHASFDKQQEEDDGFYRSMSLCSFRMEERLEVFEALSGREERSDLAKHTGAKARFQRRLRREEKQRLVEHIGQELKECQGNLHK